MVSDLIQSPGVLGSKGFTWGKVYWGVKVDRFCWEAEEEEEAMRYRAGSRGVFGIDILVEIQASLVGIIPLDIERRMRSWRGNGLRNMEYGQNSACWGWQESQW